MLPRELTGEVKNGLPSDQNNPAIIKMTGYLRHRPLLVLAIILALTALLLLTFAAAKRHLRGEPLQLPEPVLAEPLEQAGKPTPAAPGYLHGIRFKSIN